MAKQKTVRTIHVERLGQLASMTSPFSRDFCPAVWRDKTGRYNVRILSGYSESIRTGSRSVSWEYFETDENGVITSCPRGMTREFKGAKIAEIEAKVEEYKDKRINHN